MQLKCKEYKKNTKRLWQVINSIVGKTKHSGRIIPFITIEGVRTYDSRKIADEFGCFYANIGANSAKRIPESRKGVHEYISRIPWTLNSLAVSKVGYTEIESIIKSLPAKSSCGHDKVSNVMLKQLCMSISYPLSIIFNQSPSCSLKE